MTIRSKSTVFWSMWAGVTLAILLSLPVLTYHAVAYGQQPKVAATQPAAAGAPIAKMPLTKVPASSPAIAEKPVVTPTSAPAKGIEDGAGIMKELAVAVRGSQWRLAVFLILAALVLGLRRFGVLLAGWLPDKLRDGNLGGFLRWPNTDRGGAAMALLAGTLAVLVNGLQQGRRLDLSLVIDGVGTALGAAGGYAVLKKLGWPSDKVVNEDPKPVPPAATQ